MDAEHTPGPWVTTDGIVNAKVNGRYCPIAKARRYVAGYESVPQIANARLISAAPDLLAACVGMLAAWNSPRNLDRVDALCKELDAMEAAVAKARGEVADGR